MNIASHSWEVSLASGWCTCITTSWYAPGSDCWSGSCLLQKLSYLGIFGWSPVLWLGRRRCSCWSASGSYLFTHEHVTVCLRRWAQYVGHVAGWASPRARYARHVGKVSQNPTRPRGTLSGRAAAMGCPSYPDRSRASPSLKQWTSSTMKNEKK
jgi:hypothetical protein